MEWEFYYYVARHCCDEVRHSELGETRLNQLGYHIYDFPSSISSYAWRHVFDPYDLIAECRVVVAQYSVVPAQREATPEKM